MARKTNFRTYTISLTANTEYPLTVAGDFFRVLENTGQFQIVFDESNRFTDLEAGMGAKFVDDYERISLLSTTTQSVVVVFGYGVFEDARASVNATINTTISPSDTGDNPSDVTVGVAATLISPALGSQKEVMIHVPSSAANSIRVGTASVAATAGIEIEPGSTNVFSVEYALYGIRTGASDVDVSLLINSRP